MINQYYGEDYDLYVKEKVTIEHGLTVLVGCNGCGKTTFLHQVRDQLKKSDVPVLYFDNLCDGGNRAMQSAAYWGDFAFAATAMSSSEGENIVLNMSKLASKIGQFVRIGEHLTRHEKMLKAITGTDDEAKKPSNERWILLDAIDSGLSVDNVVEIKEYLFKTILKDAKNYDIYILVAANAYEMCRDEQCFDVHSGRYIQFENYEEYRNFVLDSKKIKESRYGEK